MKDFAELIQTLDETTKTTVRVDAMAGYFQKAAERDAVWTIALLSGKRPKRAIKVNMIREWAAEMAGIPLWLFEESYHVVGDLAETVALILPESETEKEHGHTLSSIIEGLIEIREKGEEHKKAYLFHFWKLLSRHERFVFNKLLTGGFRIGVSRKLMTRALAKATGIDENKLALRLMGDWDPQRTSFQKLVLEEDAGENLSRPYPFYLAYALEGDIEELGKEKDWIAERKWDGIRGQIVYRGGHLSVWSRGEELVTDKYPEYQVLTEIAKEDFVIDGEILAWKDEQPLAFQALQTRIGRKTVGKKLLETTPVIFMAYDILEKNGEDIRKRPLHERRALLESLIGGLNHEKIRLSPIVKFRSWTDLIAEKANSRALHCEGLMLKQANSPYEIGRKKGMWWKWKVDPLTIDAVMIYAMRGHGRRANLYTDYTFALRDGEELVPFTKAYSGLTDEEFRQVDAFVKKNTLERFGPVRSVKPELVFEIAFEGITESKRHKSGIALRFPRMSRWRKDKAADEINTLDDLKELLKSFS